MIFLVKNRTFSFEKMGLKMSSGKWRPFWPGEDELSFPRLTGVARRTPTFALGLLGLGRCWLLALLLLLWGSLLDLFRGLLGRWLLGSFLGSRLLQSSGLLDGLFLLLGLLQQLQGTLGFVDFVISNGLLLVVADEGSQLDSIDLVAATYFLMVARDDPSFRAAKAASTIVAKGGWSGLLARAFNTPIFYNELCR